MNAGATMFETDATSLNRLIPCNGSRNMVAPYPISSNDQAKEEGNAAHWVAVQIFTGVEPNALINTKAFNGYIITDEMINYVSEYVQALDCGEMEVDTSFSDNLNFRVNGRCDHRKFDPLQSILYIDDFKSGYRIVEPFENWTLLAHAIGTIIQLGIQPQTICLRIHQPRAYHPGGKLREWRFSIADLWNIYYPAIVATLSNLADTLVSGPYCGNCTYLAGCPAARLSRMNALDAISLQFNDDLPDDALTYDLELLQRAKSIIENQYDALQELAIHRLQNGKVLGNYSLEQRYGNRTWRKGISPETISTALGVDIRKNATGSPADAERKGANKIAVSALTERPFIGIKLIRVDQNERANQLLKKGKV